MATHIDDYNDDYLMITSSSVEPCEAASHATPSRILLIGEGTRNVSSKITGNNRGNVEILASLYEKMRDKMPSTPSEHPTVRVRAKLADLIFEESPKLHDVRGLIDELAVFGHLRLPTS